MNNNQLENIVIVALIIVGVGAGIYFRTQGDSQLAAVLLALALAAILYKFLGGNQAENSLSIGVLKFGGSAAVLGGFIWLLSEVIFDKDVPPTGERIVSVTPTTGWYAAELNSGVALPVSILLGDSIVQTFPVPARRTLADRSYRLQNSEGDRLPLLPYAGGDTLGYVPRDLIRSFGGDPGTGTDLVLSPSEVISFTLYPNDRTKRSSTQLEQYLIKRGRRESPFPFPFEIRTFGSSFKIQERSGGEVLVSDREVRRNFPFLLESGGKRYLVFAMHANFLLPDQKDHFTEWAVIAL